MEITSMCESEAFLSLLLLLRKFDSLFLVVIKQLFPPLLPPSRILKQFCVLPGSSLGGSRLGLMPLQ